ncbi:MAG: DNA methyltransferase [candidate division WOR-3 bacterium]
MPKKEKEEPIKDLDNLKPIDHGVIAYPHTPVYKMHRYFARRPWSVFNELIRHYSNPGSIILDPFCGGGVTIVEGLRLRRKVIGIDINPMATFITKMEVIDVDLEEIKKAFKEIEKSIKEEIEQLYLTKCPKCGKENPAEWFEWSYIYECPKCKKKVQLSEAKKITKGKYQCNSCKEIFRVIDAKRVGEIPIRLKVNCVHCGFKGEKNTDEYDLKKVKWIEENFEKIIKDKKLWYPKDKIIYGKETQRLFRAGFKYFYELFTKRNLISLAILLKEIKKIKKIKIKELLLLTFCNNLRFATSMCFCAEKWRGGEPLEWAAHGYWMPNLFAEVNILKYFRKCFRKVIKGKEESQEKIGNYYQEAKNFLELQKDKTCLLLTRSSTELPFPNETIDTIITDPPYGGNVNYTELSDFWAIWIKEVLGLKPDELINWKEEAVVNKYQRKGIKEYRNLMYQVFKECYRVLKPNRWLVMTFHNRDFQVWNAIHLAAHDAGFILPEKDGMIYQPPIREYTTTLHQRSGGAMLGDFILSFKKAEKLSEKKLIEYVDIGKKIEEMAAETIQYHGGATLNQIYLKLIPFLVNEGLLEKITESELPKYLTEKFEEKNGRWYFKEKLDPEMENYLKMYNKEHFDEESVFLDFIPVEVRLETIIRWLLIQKGEEGAKMDEILNAVYSRLINSNAPEYGEISRVLTRIATLRPDNKRYWVLKEDLARQMLLKTIEEKISEKDEKMKEMSEHDLIIWRLLDLGEYKGYGCHVGLKEQNNMVEFKKRSESMVNNVQYGMDKYGFDIVRQIDVLWLKGNQIVAAFEVEKSTTIDSGINRFRNLFAVQPNSTISCFIVVPDKRENEAIRKLNSPANKKEGISERVKILKFSDLKLRRPIEEVKIEI